MISNYYLLPEFTPARLQDLVLWLEPASLRGNTWYNLAPCYGDRNHGTAHGGVGLSTWYPQFLPAPIFYGDDEYVEVPDSENLDITDAITIEFWGIVKAQSPDEQHFVSKGYNRYLFYIGRNSYRLIFWFAATNPHSYGYFILTPNVLTHVVGTYDKDGGDNNYKVYINGELHHQYTLTGAIGVDNGPLCIGRMGSLVERFLNGLIPLVRIYKAALTPTEVVHNYTHHPLHLLQRGIDPYVFIKRKKFYFL